MRFSDLVCILHFGDDAEFEQEHDRDENGRFSSSRLLKGTKSKSEFKREHKAKTVEEFYGEEIKGRGLTGRRAVSRLVQEQRGHIKAAFHRDDMGDIDLVWGDMPLDVILPFATPSTFHGVAKHAIFAGVQRQRRSAPAEQGAQHL